MRRSMMTVGGAAPITYSFNGNAQTGTNTATPSFSVPFGAEAPDRYIIVGVAAQDGDSANKINSVTIGGVAATLLAERSYQASWDVLVSFFGALVPAGTSGTVAVSAAGILSSSGVGCWSIYNYSSTAIVTSAFAENNAGTILSTTLSTVPKGGVVLSVCTLFSTANKTFTWSGITENYDAIQESAVATHSGASVQLGSAQTNYAISAQPSSTGGRCVLLAVVFA